METIKVNQDICIGCGACQAIASDVFVLNDDGLAEAKEDNNQLDTMNDELKNDVMDALEGCPTSAIYVDKEKSEN